MRLARVTFWSFLAAASMGAWACVGDKESGTITTGAEGGASDASTLADGPSGSTDGSQPSGRSCDGGTAPGFGLFDTGKFKLWFSIEHATGTADFEFAPTAAGSNIAVAGHWVAGDDTVGWFTQATVPSYTLLSANTADAPVNSFSYGPDGDKALLPVVGDWQGDGATTVGVYHQGDNKFFLAIKNAQTAATYTFVYGTDVTNGRPVAGDWDGDGKDGVGIFVPGDGRFLLRNTFESGAAELVIQTGHTGDDLWPLAANWDGCGVTVALYSQTTGRVTYRETNTTEAPEHTFNALAGKVPLIGRWKR